MASLRLNTIKLKRSLTKKGLRYFFTIHAPNGEKLERSQMYETNAGRWKRIKKIKEAEKINEDKTHDHL